jgi:bacillolysin
MHRSAGVAAVVAAGVVAAWAIAGGAAGADSTAGPSRSAPRAPAVPAARELVSAAVGRPVRVLAEQPGTDPARTAQAYVGGAASRLGLTQAQLRQTAVLPLAGGAHVVRYQQIHGGLPVLGGQLVVTVTSSGGVLSARAATTAPDPAPAAAPARLTAGAARETALRTVTTLHRGVQVGDLTTEAPQLSWYDPALLHVPTAERTTPGPVWQVHVRSVRGAAVEQVVLVNAATGGVALTYGEVEALRNQVVCDGANKPNPDWACTHGFARSLGDPASGVADVNKAWDNTFATYDFYQKNTGIDLADLIGSTANGSGKLLRSTVRVCPSTDFCPFDNAFWDGHQMVYGDGYAGADDVVAHELTHGVTEQTSQLFYYQESGAINESMSDVFGEFTDLSDGTGNDSPQVRWQLGEDLPGGAVRDMADPTRYDQPDRMTSPKWNPDPADNGGVHIDSGVGNKAAQLIVDGGTFNGQQITGLGLEKAAKIYWEVEEELTSGATYADLYVVLPQACRNLATVGVLSAADCAQVTKAVTATEMNLEPATVPPTPKPAGWCPTGTVRGDLASDGFEEYENEPLTVNWLVQGHWEVTTANNPHPGEALRGYPGPAQDNVLTSTAPIEVPTGVHPYLRLEHDIGLPADSGALVEASADGKKWTSVPWVDNGYNGTAPDGKTKVFAGESHRWLSSRADLGAYAGKQVYLRLRILPSYTPDNVGWWLDDLTVYGCGNGTPTAPRDLWFDFPPSFVNDAYLLWHPPAYLGDKVTEYQVTVSPGGKTVTVPPTRGSGGPTDSRFLAAHIDGLKQGVTYTFQVRGRVGNGAWGLPSAPAVLHGTTNLLSKPAKPSAGKITLSGRATDADTHKPISIPDLLVPILSRPAGSTTWDSDDQALLTKDGTYTITLPYKPNHEYMAEFPGVVGLTGPWHSGSDSTIVRVP